MSFLEWSAEYEFGIPEIDSQHRRWLEILNSFYDHLNESALKEHLLKTVDQALEYTLFHFGYEEEFMGKIGYPRISEQRQMHIDIVNLLKKFKRDILDDKVIVSTGVTRELKRWFNEHILVEDKAYADFFNAKR